MFRLRTYRDCSTKYIQRIQSIGTPRACSFTGPRSVASAANRSLILTLKHHNQTSLCPLATVACSAVRLSPHTAFTLKRAKAEALRQPFHALADYSCSVYMGLLVLLKA